MINILKTISTYTTTASSLHKTAPPPPLPEPQKENREMRDILSNISDTTNTDIRRAAGIMRYQVSAHDFASSEDKKKMIKIVDIFIDTMV